MKSSRVVVLGTMAVAATPILPPVRSQAPAGPAHQTNNPAPTNTVTPDDPAYPAYQDLAGAGISFYSRMSIRSYHTISGNQAALRYDLAEGIYRTGVILGLSQVPAPPGTPPALGYFSDQPWPDISQEDSASPEQLRTRKIMPGYPYGTFGGPKAATRYEAAITLYNMLLPVLDWIHPIFNPPPAYQDVMPGTPEATAVDALRARGIFPGYVNETFGGVRAITYNELAVVLDQAFHKVRGTPLTFTPFDLTVFPGEIKVEGKVESVNKVKNEVVLLVSTVTLPGKPPAVLPASRLKVVSVQARLTLVATLDRVLALAAIHTGVPAAAVGKDLGAGKPLPARVLFIPDAAAK